MTFVRPEPGRATAAARAPDRLKYNGRHAMRILVLLPSLTDLVGGIQTYSQALVSALSALGQGKEWRIEVLGLHDHAKISSVAPDLPGVMHHGFSGSRIRFSMAAIWAARGSDLILLAHVNFAPLLLAMRWLAPNARCRVSAHGIEVWRPLGRLVTSALLYAGEVWPVSDYTRQRTLAENPTLQGLRFGYLPNTLGPAYPPANPAKSKAELGFAGKKLVLCVSRLSSLERYKNVDQLLRSLPAVLQQVPEAFLVVVGPGNDRPRLAAMAEELRIREQVYFAGRVTDEVLQSILAACDLFVLPSTGEGFGIVYLEAMYHGKACIGARAGGVPEVIEHEVTGVLVDPEHMDRLAEVMTRLLIDDARRCAMGAAGKLRLQREFSTKRFRERLAALIGAGN